MAGQRLGAAVTVLAGGPCRRTPAAGRTYYGVLGCPGRCQRRSPSRNSVPWWADGRLKATCGYPPGGGPSGQRTRWRLWSSSPRPTQQSSRGWPTSPVGGGPSRAGTSSAAAFPDATMAPEAGDMGWRRHRQPRTARHGGTRTGHLRGPVATAPPARRAADWRGEAAPAAPGRRSASHRPPRPVTALWGLPVGAPAQADLHSGRGTGLRQEAAALRTERRQGVRSGGGSRTRITLPRSRKSCGYRIARPKGAGGQR